MNYLTEDVATGSEQFLRYYSLENFVCSTLPTITTGNMACDTSLLKEMTHVYEIFDPFRWLQHSYFAGGGGVASG